MRAILLAWLMCGICGVAFASGSPFPGTYKGEDVVIEIHEVGQGRFAGAISSQGQVLSFTARQKADALVGALTVDDEITEFRITIKGSTLTFVMEEESHTLIREGTRTSLSPEPSGAKAGTAKASSPEKPDAARQLRINGVVIDQGSLRKLEQEQHILIPRGDFWYDKISGGWGVAGGPTVGFTTPGMDLGGPLQANASRGDTGVFINGRELPLQDVVGLQNLNVSVQRGRWWVDSSGNYGMEGIPISMGNLFQFSRGRGGAYQRSTAGGYIGGDGETSYFFDPKTGSSVMTGN